MSPEVSLYENVVTQDQRVSEESIYDGGVGPTGNGQEAVYSQPDISKKKVGVSVLNADKLLIANQCMCISINSLYCL